MGYALLACAEIFVTVDIVIRVAASRIRGTLVGPLSA